MKEACPWTGSLEMNGFVKKECLVLTRGCHAITIFESLGLSISPFVFHFYFHALLVFFFFRFLMPELAQLTLEMNNVENISSSSSIITLRDRTRMWKYTEVFL